MEAGSTMKNQPKPGQWVLMASGAVMLLFSFFAFYKVSGFDKSWNSWSGDGAFPLSWWPVLFGVAIAVAVALTVFASVSLPDNVLGFSRNQIYFILSFTSFVILLGFLLWSPTGLDKGIGFWFMFLASIGLLVGSVMELQDRSTSTGPARQGPATPF
jgi:hypothetical protein